MTKDFFTIPEVVKSATAKQKGIDNTPTPQHEANLRELIDKLLNPFRAGWGDWCARFNLGDPRIEVTSGYRSFELNKAIRGSNTSAHPYGFAADTKPYNGNMKEYRKFAEYFLKDKIFDQCIFEEINAVGEPKWIHLGWKNSQGLQRKQFMTWDKIKYSIINVN